jgi:hypothetical protein
MVRTALLAVTLVAVTSVDGLAQDWLRFRGPQGNGVASESDTLPTEWSPSANLAWKTPLPGPGASSPIIVKGKVFVTCYSGYGLDQESPGSIEDLVRHLVCVDLQSGEKLWQKDVQAAMPEDPYTGAGVPAHGYASHTPVSDGTNVYAFFGKSGVHAFDMDGNPLWQADVGKESDPNRWGSSASPIVFEDTVIVTASAESQAIVGLDRQTGKERWRQEAAGLDNMWGTPCLVEIDDNRTDLVMCVAGELWGLDPHNGKLRWYANATGAQHAYASVVTDGTRVFAITSRGGGSIALDAGGSGDVSESKTVWTGRDTASFASPVRHGSKLYSVTRGIVSVIDAGTGQRLQRPRLEGAEETGGRFGSLDYPSPIVVGNHLYYLNGSGQMFVFELGDEMQLVAVNRVTPEKEIFRGTPAVADNRLVMRSQTHLYCVTNKGEAVDPEDNLMAQVEATAAEDEEAGEGRGGRGGGQRFDPMAMFTRMDTNGDGQLGSEELEGNAMADRLKTLDKDSDGAVSKDEFQTGIASLFRGGGGRGRGGAGGGYEDNQPVRPERPRRPESAGG